jgi:hypothetical protein
MNLPPAIQPIMPAILSCFARRGTFLLAVFAVSLAISGCNRDGRDVRFDDDDTLEALVFQPIGRGNHAAVDERTERVFRTEDEWLSFSRQLRPLQPFPRVDFTQMMVVVAIVPVTEGGHSVEFDGFEVDREGVLAEYVVQQPGDDCMTAAVISQPFQVVQVRRHEADVRFDHRTQTYRCRLGSR